MISFFLYFSPFFELFLQVFERRHCEILFLIFSFIIVSNFPSNFDNILNVSAQLNFKHIAVSQPVNFCIFQIFLPNWKTL